MSRLLLPLAMLMLIACDRTETTELTTNYIMPPELKNCRIYTLSSESSQRLWVTVCPKHTSTDWEKAESCGKNCTTYKPYNTSVENYD